MMETVRKIYPIRSCNKNITKIKGKERPCMNYHINRCIGPCLAEVSMEEYKALIDKVCDFLDGNDELVIKRFREFYE